MKLLLIVLALIVSAWLEFNSGPVVGAVIVLVWFAAALFAGRERTT